MEKIGCDLCGEPFTDIESIQNKLNEIVEWINEHEKYVQPLEKAWKQAVEEVLKQAKEKQGV